MSRFPMHGQLDIRVEGRLLIAGVEGPWNIEFVQHALREMHSVMTQLSEAGPWGLIIVISNAAVCPPDALEAIRNGAIEQHAQMQRICAAHVIAPDVDGYGVLDRIWRQAFEGVHPFEIFETLPAAIRWAESLIQSESVLPADAIVCPS